MSKNSYKALRGFVFPFEQSLQSHYINSLTSVDLTEIHTYAHNLSFFLNVQVVFHLKGQVYLDIVVT